MNARAKGATPVDRYAKQVLVKGVGAEGQERIRSLEVEIRGPLLAAEICALYLAGAGARRLVVPSAIADRVRAVSSEVVVVEGEAPSGELELHGLGGARTFALEDPLLAGASAARWALARAISGEGG